MKIFRVFSAAKEDESAEKEKKKDFVAGMNAISERIERAGDKSELASLLVVEAFGDGVTDTVKKGSN